MDSIITGKTETNLREAFAAETLAIRRYLAFAVRSGMPRAAAAFRAKAAAHADQAKGHLEAAHTDAGSGTVYDLRLRSRMKQMNAVPFIADQPKRA